MRAVTLAIAVAIVASASRSAAQDADAGSPAQPPDAGDVARADGGDVAQAPESIELEVGAREARAIDVSALREALARELGIEVRVTSAAAIEVPRVRLRRITRSDAMLELVRPDRSRMRRHAALPADPAERLETIVILAVNMVRDEASELLAMLRRRRAPADTAEADTDAADTDAADTDAADTDADTASTDTDAAETDATDTASTDTDATDTGATETDATETGATDAATETAPIDGATETTAPSPPDTAVDVAADPPGPPAAPGQRVFRIALGALLGSVPRAGSYEVALVSGLELAWTPTDFLAFGLRDLGGGTLLSTNQRWSAGGAAFAELGWIVDPALVLHLELGADVRINGSDASSSAGVAPLLLVGARWFPIRELSLALQTALHVVATDAWTGNLHALPQGAVLWTIGLSIAGHVS
jgi:hypothetical protein